MYKYELVDIHNQKWININNLRYGRRGGCFNCFRS
jgi:hypothetical protein